MRSLCQGCERKRCMACQALIQQFQANDIASLVHMNDESTNALLISAYQVKKG